MAYATNEERLEYIKSNPAFGYLPFVVRIKTWRGESEFHCDGFEHAYDMAISWKETHKAEYVEIFRVDNQDGSLYGGIGAL